MNPRFRRWLRKFLEPRIFVPTLLCLALLAIALGVTDLPRVFERLSQVSIVTAVNVLGLTLVYLILKGLQLRILLQHLDVHVPWRPLILAFAIGEMTLTIPSGVYAQNYVLQRLGLAEFARSAAATTITLAIEGAILVAALVAIGVPGWAWLRPFLFAFCALMTTAIVAIAHSSRISQWINRLASGGRLAKPARGLIDIVEGVRVNMVPRVLLPCVLLGFIYMAALVDGLVVVAHGTGLSGMTFTQATSIYFFSLGIAMTVGGILTQLGVIEVAGLGAAKAWGYDLSDALAMLLGFRLLWMGCIWVVCGSASAGLWRLFPRSGVDRGQEATN